jgi:hypothetical protein
MAHQNKCKPKQTWLNINYCFKGPKLQIKAGLRARFHVVSLNSRVLAKLDSKSYDGYHEGARNERSIRELIVVGGSLSSPVWGFSLATITLP